MRGENCMHDVCYITKNQAIKLKFHDQIKEESRIPPGTHVRKKTSTANSIRFLINKPSVWENFLYVFNFLNVYNIQN